MKDLSFSALRAANSKRCNSGVFGHSLGSWSLPEWACAMAGETGEACNVVKKIHRGDFGALREDGTPMSQQALDDLADELADVVCYLDLLAARAGIDLGMAVRAKFNRVSQKRGSDVRL